GYMPTTVMPVDFLQECLTVVGTAVPPNQEQPSSGDDIHGPEQHPLAIHPTDRHGSRLTPSRPTRTQGREQPQVDLIFRQDHTPGRQGCHTLTDGAFFSRAGDPAVAHNGSASTRIPADPIAA